MESDDWREAQVADLIAAGLLAINDGYRVRNTELGPVGTPFVRGGDIGNGWIHTEVADRIRPEFQDRVSGKLTREGDIAFITKGTVGRVGFLRVGQPSVVFAPQVCYWRVLNTAVLDRRFLYFLLNGPEFQANLDAVKTHGSMVADYVSLSDQRQFRLRLPRIETQRAIGRILGSLDDKIELNRQTNETLEAVARTLFESWFVDFDPVRAKAGIQTPPGLDAATATLFPDSFEPSALGPIPRGWRVKPIGEMVDVAGGSTPSTHEPTYWNGPHQFATPKDMAALSSPVLMTTDRTITAAGLERISSGLLPAGTVLMSSRAPIGYLAITEVPVAVNQGFIAMKCPAGMPNHYVLQWARENMDEIISRANGTTFLEISKTNFRTLKALVPDARVLKAFADFVSPLHLRVVANLREAHILVTTRDALLPKLLSGEVTTA